jgi:hypothetical protein
MQYTVNVPFNFDIQNSVVSFSYETIELTATVVFDRKVTLGVTNQVLAKDPSMRDFLAQFFCDECKTHWQEIMHYASLNTWVNYANYAQKGKWKNWAGLRASHKLKEARAVLTIICPPPPNPFTLQDIKGFRW